MQIASEVTSATFVYAMQLIAHGNSGIICQPYTQIVHVSQCSCLVCLYISVW